MQVALYNAPARAALSGKEDTGTAATRSGKLQWPPCLEEAKRRVEERRKVFLDKRTEQSYIVMPAGQRKPAGAEG